MSRPVTIVTGGSRGIGAGCCRMLAARGHDIAFSYHSDEKAAARVVAEVEVAGGQALAIRADMSREEGILDLFTAADARFGRLDHVVINAGSTGRIKRVVDMTAAEIQAVMDLNAVGALICARESIRRLSTATGGRGGTIVIVSSIAATLGSPNEFVHYAAAKGAASTMTIGLAREVAKEGIRVNAVAPGLIETDIHASAGAPDRVERLKINVPMGRGGTVEETVEAILWLLSDASRYVTGAIIPVSGGR